MSHEFDDRELEDVPPSEPAGYQPVKFDVPVPRIEQITAEIARQVIASQYQDRGALMRAAQEAMVARINQIIEAKVTPIIEELLTKPIRPTDAFGNPIGEPTTLQGALARRVTDWCGDVVDGDGKPKKSDGYNTSYIHPRLDWLLGKIVNGELKKQVDAEVNRIVAQLKASATQNIAKQIAEKISGLVLK